MKDYLVRTGKLAACLTIIIAFALTLAAGAGAFTPGIDPRWLILTVPLSLIVAAALLALLVEVVS